MLLDKYRLSIRMFMSCIHWMHHTRRWATLSSMRVGGDADASAKQLFIWLLRGNDHGSAEALVLNVNGVLLALLI